MATATTTTTTTTTITMTTSALDVNVPTTRTEKTSNFQQLNKKQKKQKKKMTIPKSKAKLKIDTSNIDSISNNHPTNTTNTYTTNANTSISIPHILSNEEYTSKSNMLVSKTSYDSTQSIQSAPPVITATATTPLSSNKKHKKNSVRRQAYQNMNTNNNNNNQNIHGFQQGNERINDNDKENQQSTNSLYTPKTIFNSVKLRRLEELKRYQQLKMDQEHFLTPMNTGTSASTSTSTSTSASTNNTTYSFFPKQPHRSLLSPSPSSTYSSYSSYSPMTTQSQSSSSQIPPPPPPLQQLPDQQQSAGIDIQKGISTWERTRPQLLEDKLIIFIDKSPVRLTFLILILIGLVYIMLGYDSSTKSTDTIITETLTAATASTTTSATTITSTTWKKLCQIIFKSISRHSYEIFITNMKIFVFVILYGVTLDLILISALDTIDIPIINMHQDDQDMQQQQQQEWLSIGKRLFQDQEEESCDNDDNDDDKDKNEERLEVSTSSSSEQQKRPPSPPPPPTQYQETKNPILRQYAIEYIRKATAGIGLFIVACGLLKSIIYTSLNMIIHTFTYLNSFIVMTKGMFATEYGAALSSSTFSTLPTIFSVTFWMEFFVRRLEFMMKLPIQLLYYILQATIGSILRFFGISWMWNKFISSVIASSSESICYQSLIFIQMMMMHIGVFLLVFYLALVHLYPEQKRLPSQQTAPGSVDGSKDNED